MAIFWPKNEVMAEALLLEEGARQINHGDPDEEHEYVSEVRILHDRVMENYHYRDYKVVPVTVLLD